MAQSGCARFCTLVSSTIDLIEVEQMIVILMNGAGQSVFDGNNRAVGLALLAEPGRHLQSAGTATLRFFRPVALRAASSLKAPRSP